MEDSGNRKSAMLPSCSFHYAESCHACGITALRHAIMCQYVVSKVKLLHSSACSACCCAILLLLLTMLSLQLSSVLPRSTTAGCSSCAAMHLHFH